MSNQALVSDSETPHYPFEFRGQAGEYFRIWVVNIALTILTLGIYSAWAKVRTQRYFYGSTYLDGSSFEYLASPLMILKGRLIAVALFAVYWFITNFFPFLGIFVFFAFLLLIPWIVARSLAFRARNSAWRNVCFGFSGNYWDVAKAFILWPILVPFTLGFIWPYVHFKQKQLMVSRSAFGDTDFGFTAQAKQFYQIYAIALVIFMILPLVIGLMSGILASLSEASQGQAANGWLMALPVVMALISAAVYYLVYVFVNTRLMNLIYNHSSLAAAQLESRLSVASLMWIYATNVLAIAVSVGLLLPWARIRLARYRAAHTGVYADAGLDRYHSASGQGVSALGEEAGEIFDVDVSL